MISANYDKVHELSANHEILINRIVSLLYNLFGTNKFSAVYVIIIGIANIVKIHK